MHVAHVLHYATVLLYDRVVPISSALAANVFSMMIFMSLLLMLLFALLKQAASSRMKDSLIVLLAICLFIMAPISLFADSRYMTGYVNFHGLA